MRFDFETYRDGVRVTFCHDPGRVVRIPGTIGGLPVRSVGTRAFYGEAMQTERIEVPPEVRVIEPHAFELCISLRELVLREGLVRIGAGAFLATALEKIRIPSTVKTIDGVRELPCRLEVDPDNPYYHSDGYGLFRGSCLISVEQTDARPSYAIPEGTRAVAPDAFSGQEDLEELSLPASLVQIPEGTLSNVTNPFSKRPGICRVHVAEDNPAFFTWDDTLYERGAFSGDGSAEGDVLFRFLGERDTYRVRSGVRRIAKEAFLRSRIREAVIPEEVSEIGEDAFAECTVTEVTLHDLKLRFPRSDTYLLKGLQKQFGANGKLYDFTFCDQSLIDRHINTDRVRMMCSRLEYPVDLSDETAASFRKILSGHMEEIVGLLAKENDTELLKMLESLGMVTDANIDRLIDRASSMKGTSGKEVLAELMDYKNRALNVREFDFSL